MAQAWIRQLEVIMTSQIKKDGKQSQLVFGREHTIGKDDLNIHVTGTKYLSLLQDAFTVEITNLTYREILLMINRQYYDIEIRAGYRNSGLHTIFKGQVLYISRKLNSDRSTTAIILCASKLVAAFGQSRMNLSLKSGINMYAALKYICNLAGVRNSFISEEFKNKIISDAIADNENVGSFINGFINKNGFVANADNSLNNVISVWDPYRYDTRQIVLNSKSITLTGGYPRLTSDGLSLTVLPTFNFMPGDTLLIDNSIINIPVESKNEVYKNYGYYLDTDTDQQGRGKYMIYTLTYNLQNRGEDFSIEILCKSRKLISNITGK